jgi:hypothetical protein
MCTSLTGLSIVELLLVQTDTVEQVRKAWIAAQRIEVRMDFQPLQDVGLFLICSLKPDKCMLVVAES